MGTCTAPSPPVEGQLIKNQYLYSEVFDLKPTSEEILKSGIGHLKSVMHLT